MRLMPPTAGYHVPDDRTERLWAIADVANYLQLPVSSIYKMTGRRACFRIPHVRINGRLRFKKADIDRWLEFLTVSNLDMLAKIAKATKGNRDHGVDSSQKTEQR